MLRTAPARSPRLAVALLALAWLAPPAAAADLGSLTRVGSGDLAYRWQRRDLVITLHDRDGRWTEEEALEVRDALDKLPDILVRKSIERAKVARIYRDVLPRNRKGARGGRSATAEVRNGYISVGDWLMAQPAERVYETVVHEFGHAIHYSIAGRLLYEIYTPGWTNLSWTNAIVDGLKSWNGFVSDYARENDHEDFADTVEFYWLAPDELKRVSPAKFRYMRDVVFEGVMSPPSARIPGKRAIDPVRPEISRLGDTVDTPGSVVQVYGKHFMGPLDGGFNAVRYGSKSAVELALSRRRIVSWVPLTAGTGSRPITVATQDGRSAPAAFRVKKPWWKFW